MNSIGIPQWRWRLGLPSMAEFSIYQEFAMHIDEAIRSRRAVKGYDAGFTLSAEEKNELLQLALLAPTAFNLQHVRLVEVSDPALRQQIREVGWGQAQMTDASMLVVVCALSLIHI